MSAVEEAAWQEFTDLFAGDQDAVNEIVTIYLDESDQLAAKLATGADEGDATAVARAAHSLKSTSNQLGARVLGGLCQQLETAGEQGDLETIRRITPEFQRELQEAQGNFRQRIEP